MSGTGAQARERSVDNTSVGPEHLGAPWWVYMVSCADDTLYTGIAKDPEARVRQHNDGRGAKYTRTRTPVTLVYREQCASRGEALKREHAIKRLSAQEKKALIEGAPSPPQEDH